MNTEYLLYRSRRLVFAFVIVACLAFAAVSQPMFSSDESGQPNASLDFPALADGPEVGLGGGG